MSQDNRQEIEDTCRNELRDLLAEHEYRFDKTHHRPRGVVVEFSRDEDRLFAVNEGDAIVLDLIRHAPPTPYYRISLNQLLWFSGVRSVPQCTSWVDQLAIFASELPTVGATVLPRHALHIDSRYCFPMSENDYEQYLSFQRGK